MAKYPITPAMLEEIIAGVEMDLTISRYANFDELRLYCYRVASAVGLVSIEIFGYRNPACREYAIQLGLALQTTNIIRDVGKDLSVGRIYLPQDELARFDYSEADLASAETGRLIPALDGIRSGASARFFRGAAALLPREDRNSMVAAEIMARSIRPCCGEMKRDRFPYFRKGISAESAREKPARCAAQLLRSCLNAGR